MQCVTNHIAPSNPNQSEQQGFRCTHDLQVLGLIGGMYSGPEVRDFGLTVMRIKVCDCARHCGSSPLVFLTLQTSLQRQQSFLVQFANKGHRNVS